MVARVVGAAVRLTVGSSDVIVECGRILPDGVGEAELDRLVAKGLVVVHTESAKAPVKPAAKS